MALPDEEQTIAAVDWGSSPPAVVYTTPEGVYVGRVPGCYTRISVSREEIEAAAFGPKPDPLDLARLADDGGPAD